MSWSGKRTARRFAIDGELRHMFVQLTQSTTDPATRRALRIHEQAARDFLTQAPHDGDITVQTNGHFENDGTGEAVLKIRVEPHEVPASVSTAEASTAEPEPVGAKAPDGPDFDKGSESPFVDEGRPVE